MTYMRAVVPALLLMIVATVGCGRVEGLGVDVVDSGSVDDGAGTLGEDATMNVRGPARKLGSRVRDFSLAVQRQMFKHREALLFRQYVQ